MSIEDNIFQRFAPNFEKLADYGFKKTKNTYKIEKIFKNGLFKAEISIDSKGKVSGTVYDTENNDEYLPLRIQGVEGAFAGEVRADYEAILEDIKEHCFSKNYFVLPQSNRITNLIIDKYGDYPEFLWEKFSDAAVFRNPESKKWYLAILDIDRSKIQDKRKGFIETAQLKLDPKKIEQLIKQDNFYPAYHMNKKYWMTVILDETVSDEKIMELVAESHSFTEKKRK